MRDATSITRPGWSFCIISIHASHAGCDSPKAMTRMRRKIFQSTHPMRDATYGDGYITIGTRISIHASHAGCDAFRFGVSIADIISIHASHAGCDTRSAHTLSTQDYFNPRIPCGMRHGSGSLLPVRVDFNPRIPRIPCGMRPTEPARKSARSNDFNPRIPCGMRLRLF